MKKLSNIVFAFLITLTLLSIGTLSAAHSSLDDEVMEHANTEGTNTTGPLGGMDLIIAPRFDLIIDFLDDLVLVNSGKYMLYDAHGGNWADAEKLPAPENEDDLLCWSLTASNTMEWTGWGFVPGQSFDNADEMNDYFEDHVTDLGSLIKYGWEWWFTGNLPTHGDGWSTEDVEGGDFWSGSYTFTDYLHVEADNANTMQAIDDYLHNGWATGIGIYDGGHAITVWGFNYDGTKDPDTEPNEYYQGIWVTDSDDDKSNPNPPDRLRYYEVEYDSTNGWWYMPTYGGGNWHIAEVNALEPFPGESRPVASAGGPYIADEGSAIILDASGSTDDDSLQYRWDFDNDHVWDTSWSSSPTVSHTWNDDYSGTVVVEVWDDILRDVDSASITVNNVAPTATATGMTIDENGTATVSGTISDPGTLDTFTVEIDWGEGTPQSYSYPAGSTSFSETHKYLDDNPTATASDVYDIDVEVTDDDTGSGTTGTSVTVNNVAPVVANPYVLNQSNSQFILPVVHETEFEGSFSDVGTLDTHTAVWDWGDSTTSAGTVAEAGGSGNVTGSHTFALPGDYTITLTVTDDDTGTHDDTMDLHVVDVDEALTIYNEYIQGLDDSYFKNNAANRKASFADMFSSLQEKWINEEYQGMIQMLSNNLRDKADGQVDGKSNNDWIIDKSTQEEICQKVDDINAYLEYLKTL